MVPTAAIDATPAGSGVVAIGSCPVGKDRQGTKPMTFAVATGTDRVNGPMEACGCFPTGTELLKCFLLSLWMLKVVIIGAKC